MKNFPTKILVSSTGVSSSDSSVSVEDIKLVDDLTSDSAAIVSTPEKLTSQESLLLVPRERHRSTLDNLASYSIKSVSAREEEVRQFYNRLVITH